MGETLESWIAKYPAVQVLRDDLDTNLRNLTDLSKEEIKDLMRMNMIMVRQFGRYCELE